jgi:cleavage stimulation factor subunit 3
MTVGSYILNFALAEQYELQNKLEETHKVFINFLAKWDPELDKIDEKAKAIMAEQQAQAPTNGSNTNGTQTKGEGEPEQPSTPTTPQANSEVEKFKNLFKINVKEVGQAWIMYMRFARRTEGMQAHRKIFGQSRKAKWLDWRVYEFAGMSLLKAKHGEWMLMSVKAMTEYHCLKETVVANKIFEAGLKRYPEEVEFAAQYLTFLININDEPSMSFVAMSLTLANSNDIRCSSSVRTRHPNVPACRGENPLGAMEFL